MSKGDETRNEILKTAVDQASQFGLEGLSIGGLARDIGMSKSGLFAHFGSKADLQIAVLDRARDLFMEVVVVPALREPRGEPRIRAMFRNWLGWMNSHPLPGGCLFAATAWEFDDRPGPVRDEVVRNALDLHRTIEKAVLITIDEGHFEPDVDPEQFAYEMYSLLLGFQVRTRLLGNADARGRVVHAFERMLAAARRSS